MDVNGDGFDDLVIFDHGFDAPPFPGAPTIYVRTEANGAGANYVRDTQLSRVGFHHCGAAGDVDNDGDIDLLVGGQSPFLYLNDGNGNFAAVTDRLSGLGSQVFTCELADVDGGGNFTLTGANAAQF